MWIWSKDNPRDNASQTFAISSRYITENRESFASLGDRDVMWRINRRRHGLFICAFNRFRIKGPPLPGHADWQEIARHPARHPVSKNRYELRRRDKIVFRSAVLRAAIRCLPVPLFPSPSSTILRRCSERRQLFLAACSEHGANTCALGEILRTDTIELSYCKIAFSAVAVWKRRRTRASKYRLILISDES